MVNQQLIHQANILEHCYAAPNIKRLTLQAPDIARSAEPGQFVNVRCSRTLEPLLRRPFSLNRIDSASGTISVLYRIVGRGTELLSAMRVGDTLDVLGPLGKGFETNPHGSKILLIAGGIGIAPFYPLAEKLTSFGHDITCLLGARSADDFAEIEALTTLGVKVCLATEDGSRGERGRVTQLFTNSLQQQHYDIAYACGPNPMLAAVKELCLKANLPLQLSLEQIMACGLGVCLGCTCEKDKEVGFLHVCSDGPVVWAEEVKL